MTYIMDESLNSRNYTPAASVQAVFGYPRHLTHFTMHHWGAPGQRFDNVTGWLCNPAAGTSAHFVVEAGRAACLITPTDAAWHAGNGKANAQTIGIEMRPEATDADYRTVSELIADLRAIYGRLPLIGHNSWTATACPGNWDLARIDREANAIMAAREGGQAAPAPTVTAPLSLPAKSPSKRKTYGDGDLHWVVEAGDTLHSIARHYGIPDQVQAIADHNGIKPDKLVVGERIWIPGQLAWTVEAPDEIRTIAAHYGVDPTWLAQYNGLPHADATIYVGNTIWIRK